MKEKQKISQGIKKTWKSPDTKSTTSINELENYLFDLDAEISTIGSMLLDKDICSELMVIVKDEDYYDDFLRAVFGVIRKLYDEGKSIDIVTVSSKLKDLGLKDINPMEKLGDIMDRTPAPLSAVSYAQIIRERAILRRMVLTCQDIMSKIYTVKTRESIELLNYAQQEIMKIAEERESSDLKSVENLLKEVFHEILDTRRLRDRDFRLIGLPSGFHELDDLTGGLQKGSLYVIAGRPAMGKTSFALKIAMNVAGYIGPDNEKNPVMFTSLEMPANVLIQQMLCISSKVNAHNLRKGILNDQEVQSLALNAGKLSELPFWVDDSSDLTISDLRIRARRMHKKHNIKLLVVDYLQILSASKAESRQIEISIISHNLKAIAKELKIPVIAVAQLNRAPEGRPDRKPMLVDLRESGAIEQDADVVLMLYREEYYNQETEKKNICEVSIQKNRLGPVGNSDLVFLKEFTRFENLAKSV